jgi:hypothetical protein
MLLTHGMVGIDSREGSRRSSFDILGALASSKGSAAMDLELETELNSSMTKLNFDALDDDNEAIMRSSSSSSSYRPARRSKRSSHESSLHGSAPPRSFHMSAVNFDPAPLAHQRQTSHGDLSMCSYSTAQTSVAQSINRRMSEQTSGGQSSSSSTSEEPSHYNKALQRLAESMKRTEESRSQVMKQRKMILTPEQESALVRAKEQLAQQNEQVSRQQTPAAAPVTPPQDTARSSIMAAFFSGSRGTLTNGLEQSRKQLGMYMGQMNNHTL